MHQLSVGTHAIVAGNWDTIYSRYIREILQRGDTFVGRNGETRSMFGCSATVDLTCGFPLTRLRKMPVKNLFREFLFDIGFDQNVAAPASRELCKSGWPAAATGAEASPAQARGRPRKRP